MHVLVTRPTPDDSALALELEKLGIEVTRFPLLDISFTSVDARALERAAAIVITSKNALRAIQENDRAMAALGSRHVVTVGNATAQLAREFGATDVKEGTSSALDLLPYLADIHATPGSPIVHLCGSHLAVDLVDALTKKSIPAVPEIAYKQIAKQALPPDLQATLRTGQIDVVTLLSGRTATTWLQLTNISDLRPALADIWHICSSEKTARTLTDAGLNLRVQWIERPTIEQLVKTVKRLAEPGALS